MSLTDGSEVYKDQLRAALEQALEGRGAPMQPSPPGLPLPPSLKIQLLRQRFEAMKVLNTFKAGDIVKWKEGLRTRLFPASGEPAIVVEVLERPAYDAINDSGMPNFGELLDLRIGTIGPNAELVIYHLPSFRMEHWIDKQMI